MSPASAQTESLLVIVITQLLVIIAAARVFGNVSLLLRQPVVCGEIAAGIILGPSALGRLFPGLFHTIFDPAVAPFFALSSQIGLILMMFLIGLEFDFGHLRENRGAAVSISVAGIVFPFGLGFVLGHWMHPVLGLETGRLNFALFMATAMSITAIPVLGRIMIELNLTRTRLGSLAISAAAVGDATGWIMLALVTAIVRSTLDPMRFALMAVETAAFALFMFFVARPALKKWASRVTREGANRFSMGAFAGLLLMVFSCAVVTSVIGIFSLFGAFLMGAVLYDAHEFREAVQNRLRDFVTVFFLPVFFTYTGLRTDVGTMEGGILWGLCGLVLLMAMLGKLGGCTLAARLNGIPWRESGMIGAMMNTRGLVELIVINVGYDLGVIPKSVFFMLVLMAVVTTYLTTPLLQRLMRSSEVEAHYLESELAARR